jgi:hypothetical protein
MPCRLRQPWPCSPEWDGIGLQNQIIFCFGGSQVRCFCALIAYRLVLVAVIMPVFSDRFGGSRNDGMMLERAMDGDPAPAYCFGLSTNQLFYVRRPLRCLDEAGQKSLNPPAWLLIPSSTVAPFARLRPDLEVRSVVETGSGPQLAAVRIDKKSGEK